MKKITSIEDVIPDPRNANKHTERGAFQLEESLRNYGAGRSIVVDKHGQIIAGNSTHEIAADMGLSIEVVQTDGTKLVVVQRTDLDLGGDMKARELAYADNRSSEVGMEWDNVQIAADLEAGVDLDKMFRKDELDEILKDLVPEPDDPPEPQIDRAEELREKWQTERGQVWEIGKHRLMCGDCKTEDMGRLMGGEPVATIFTDPPYGMRLDTDYSKMPRGENTYAPVVGDDADFNPDCIFTVEADRYCVWGADWFVDKIPKGMSPIVWDKQPQHCEAGPQNHFELCWCLPKEKRRIIRHLWTGYTAKESNESRFHPTQKPVSVCKDILGDNKGNVYDPFLGSGTTMVAAEQLGRTCYGMEISPAYVAVALQRMADMGLDPVLANG